MGGGESIFKIKNLFSSLRKCNNVGSKRAEGDNKFRTSELSCVIPIPSGGDLFPNAKVLIFSSGQARECPAGPPSIPCKF